MDLYRYMPFEYFVDMVLNKELAFVDPVRCWPDKCEGFLYSLMKNEDGQELIKKEIEKLGIDNGMDVSELAKVIKEWKDPHMRLMSWTQNGDSINMWNAYSYNSKAIMIKVSEENIYKIKYKLHTSVSELDMPVFMQEMVYVHELNIDEVLIETMKKKGLFYFTSIFKYKRDIYEYEKEIRATVVVTRDSEKKVLRLSYEHIPDFIETVKVHPDADEGFVEIVQRFCDRSGIPFSGKSKLHEFDIDKIKID